MAFEIDRMPLGDDSKSAWEENLLDDGVGRYPAAYQFQGSIDFLSLSGVVLWESCA